MNKGAYLRTVFILSLLLCCSALAAVCIGRLSVNPLDVYQVISSKLAKQPVIDETLEAMDTVLFKIRIPRTLAAMMVGAMLSLSGAVYQGVFKNPLVSPDILGVSSGASVGAASAILFGLGMVERQSFAFLGGIFAVVLATTIPKLLKNYSNLVLVLSGIIVSGFLTSLLAIMKFVAEEQTELSAIVFWQMGSFSPIDMKEVVAISPAFFIGTSLLMGLSWRINILSFGEVEAKTLGMNVRQIRGITIACASFLTASAVSICGTIGWIGLVIPHLARLLVGSDHTKMIPVTVISGALFMLVIDTIARALLTVEIPLSILTGVIGAPCYAWLLYRQRANVF
ncbi:MAG TPA: iron ABC transporter permease [Firmicutes bacterium]|jgi:iron complex transport system permease protein|nr:iron ABC transporter permease [Bacillota bacterium]